MPSYQRNDLISWWLSTLTVATACDVDTGSVSIFLSPSDRG